MARPKKYNQDEMIEIIDTYTEAEDIPILKEVCQLNRWNHKYIYELADKNEKLSESIKMLIYKKEVSLEKLGLMGIVNSTMAIFSLKQLGWTDKQETQHTTVGADGKPKGLEIIVKRADS